MRRDAALHAHADRCQLAVPIDPDSRMAFQACRLDTERGRGVDDRGLQDAHVAAQVERIAELHDRVGNELAGAMEGDVAASVDADQLRADLAQAIGRGEHVRRVAASADGVDREVLEEQQPVADPAPATLIGQLVLQLPGRPVGDGAEVLDRQEPAVGGQQWMLVACRSMWRVAIRSSRAGRGVLRWPVRR